MSPRAGTRPANGYVELGRRGRKRDCHVAAGRVRRSAPGYTHRLAFTLVAFPTMAAALAQRLRAGVAGGQPLGVDLSGEE